MLVNFAFSNFRSFKNTTILSMEAGRQTSLKESLIKDKGLKLIPSSVIYGANASGKSNIIMALSVMKEIVLSGTLNADIPQLKNLELYPFIHDCDEKPIHFEIDFIHKGYRICYAFEVALSKIKSTSRKIVSEKLSLFEPGYQIDIFTRDAKGIHITKNKKTLKILEFKEKLLSEFEKKINENIDSAELFLTRAFKSTISNKLADIVLDFFSDALTVVSDFTLKKVNLLFSIKEESKKDFLLWNKILDGFVKNADFGPQDIAFIPERSENEDSSKMKLVSIYKFGDKNFAIPAEFMESRGTLKLIDFAIPFENMFKSGGVFVLDEFDSAIHPELVKGILAIFNNPEINKSGAQLIFTTHNPIYLNNKIFRRDQIRFVEKDKDSYESILYSLADFGSETVRNDHNYLINYFKGNYGALPFIDFSNLLKDDKDTENENGNV